MRMRKVPSAFPWTGNRRLLLSDRAAGALRDLSAAGVGKNEFALAGVLTDVSRHERDDEGAPVSILTLAFQREGEYAPGGAAVVDVIVAQELAAEHEGVLQVESVILVSGQLAGSGRVRADSLALIALPPSGGAGGR